jgi:hypothetical protein
VEKVPDMTRFLGESLSAGALARLIGVGRVTIGVAFLAAPVASVRILGLDATTAKRITFLARMTAARDLGLGAGTLAGGGGPASAAWLAAGALADAADAVAIVGARRAGVARGVPAAAIAAGAAASAVAGLWAAQQLRDRD